MSDAAYRANRFYVVEMRGYSVEVHPTEAEDHLTDAEVVRRAEIAVSHHEKTNKTPLAESHT